MRREEITLRVRLARGDVVDRHDRLRGHARRLEAERGERPLCARHDRPRDPERPEPSQQRECPRHRDDVGDVGALELQETSDPLGE